MKIAIQGVRGAFHHEAAESFFGNEIEIVECNTFKAQCEALIHKNTDFVIMAIENTLGGSILPNFKLIREYHLKIIGEIYIPIHLNLITNENVQLQDIKFVHSHPMAIRQCEDFLMMIPQAKVVEENDTAESVRNLKDNKRLDSAAVAGNKAAELYGMHILERNIETHKRNFTRFLALSELPDATAANKATLCFELANRSGELARVCNIYADNNVNLTKIQSMPIAGKPYEYTFYIDVEWERTEDYYAAQQALMRHAANVTVMGEYKRAQPVIFGGYDNKVVI